MREAQRLEKQRGQKLIPTTKMIESKSESHEEKTAAASTTSNEQSGEIENGISINEAKIFSTSRPKNIFDGLSKGILKELTNFISLYLT